MDAINRVRVEGKAVVRTERTMDKGKPFYQLHYPFEANDFPGGARTICLALTMRMQQLVGMPVPDDERDGPTEEGVDEKPIDRLAASIEVLEPAERWCTDRRRRAETRTAEQLRSVGSTRHLRSMDIEQRITQTHVISTS